MLSACDENSPCDIYNCQMCHSFQVASDCDHEYGEMEEDDDQDKFSYQLLAVSSLARLVADYSLPLLTKYVKRLCVVPIAGAWLSFVVLFSAH